MDAADAVVASAGSILMEGGRLAVVAASHRPAAPLAVFLGDFEGRDIVATSAGDDSEGAPKGRLVPLREALATFSRAADREADLELAVTAVAMIEWHTRHQVCARCGALTEPRNAGWMRLCLGEGHEHYPRTDPAVIVAITDERDRLLLAHVGYHTSGRYSHLAGYLEPGESLEQAAHREIREEASLRLDHLEYVGSQPWPFPASIMVGFTARATSTDLEVDGVEVTDAMWLTRDELRARLGDGSIRLASPGTIARSLIHEWYGGNPVEDAGVADA